MEGLVFGTQRPPGEVAALALLFIGFSGLAIAFWIFTSIWLGALLPVGFLLGALPALRTDVRQIELRGEVLLVRTFFREYPIPRAHVTNVVRTPEGVAIDVVNGNRYGINPAGIDPQELHRAAAHWLATGSSR